MRKSDVNINKAAEDMNGKAKKKKQLHNKKQIQQDTLT